MILDAGAVLALARGDARARAFVARAVETGSAVFVPAVVIAETARGNGPRDAPVNRVLAAVDSVMAADESVGRTAGALLGRAGSDQTIDALAVAGAIEHGGGHILTSDPRDMRALARGRTDVSIHSV